MPIPLQLVGSLLVGLVFALAAHRQAADGRSPFARNGLVPVFYQLVLVTPAVLYLGLVHPAWSWLFLVPPERLPFGIVGLALVGTAAAEAGGYLVGWQLLKLGRRREVSIATAVLGLVLLVALVLLRARVGHAGTYAEFELAMSPSLAARKLGWAVGIIDLGLLAGFVTSVLFLVEQGERER
ncbi:MAG: hypothetical protein ABI321_17170 [Polyangia bacterium]